MSTIEGEIKQACAARANLHVFAAVIGLLESGAIVGGCTAQVAANRIIAICKKEEQRQLTKMDKAIERSLVKAGG